MSRLRRRTLRTRARGLFLLMLLSALSVMSGLSACNAPLYRDVGAKALQRGQHARGLANLIAAREQERTFLSRRGKRRLNLDINRAVHRLATPALESARHAIDVGDGDRALAILLPLYGGKGLYRHLNEDGLEEGRARLLPVVRHAVSVASGVNLRALTTGVGAVRSMSASVAAVRKQVEAHIPRAARGPVLAMLGKTAQPVLKAGWRLVDGHLQKRHFEKAMDLADRLAAVLPNDRALQARAAGARARAASYHQEQASKYAAKPGLQWAHHTLAQRYQPGHGGASGSANAIVKRLRRTQFRVGKIAACGALTDLIRRQVQRGSGGVPIDVEVQLRTCRGVNKAWKTRKRVSWTERRSRRVKVRERYRATVYDRKCRYVRVYANTTCSTTYVGNGMSRRTCTPHYNSMQRCRSVPRSVTRTRIVTKVQHYTVRLSLMRVMHWQDTSLTVAGHALVRWPGGGTTVPLSYKTRVRDYGYSDRAGTRRAKRMSLQQMTTQAVGRVRQAVHQLATRALQPQATRLSEAAQRARQAGDLPLAADLALQAWLTAGLKPVGLTKTFSALLSIPRSLAQRPAAWSQRASAARSSRRRSRGGLPSKLSLSAGAALRRADLISPERLVSPRLPRPDRGVRRRYRELRSTAWRRRDSAASGASFGVDVGPSHLLASRTRLTLRAALAVRDNLRLRGGMDLSAFGLGTGGWQAGMEMGVFRGQGGLSYAALGLRYARHGMVAGRDLAASTLRSSNLDLSYGFRVGRRLGFVMQLAVNALAWLGDDAYRHYHPQEVAVDYRIGPIEARAGLVWHVGGGGFRWKAGLGFAF